MIGKKTSLPFAVVHVYSRAGRAPALLPPQLAHVAAALALPALPSPPPVAASNATRVPDLPAIDRCASMWGSAGGRRAGADPGVRRLHLWRRPRRLHFRRLRWRRRSARGSRRGGATAVGVGERRSVCGRTRGGARRGGLPEGKEKDDKRAGGRVPPARRRPSASPTSPTPGDTWSGSSPPARGSRT